jgi:YD repeat-containing protein
VASFAGCAVHSLSAGPLVPVFKATSRPTVRKRTGTSIVESMADSIQIPAEPASGPSGSPSTSSVARYAAFLSYKQGPVDSGWALWLLRELEVFRTPGPLVDLGYPPRLGTLYRDDDEATAANGLDGQIVEALAHSRWLIVVLSPRTASSEWVARELVEFARIHTVARILPVVVEGDPPEVRRLFAKVLGEEAAGQLPLGADLRLRPGESQRAVRRRALLRIAAALLECGFDDLARRDEEREARRRRVRRLTAAGVALALAMGTLLWWDRTLRIKTGWYRQVDEAWAAPVGRGPLSQAEAARRRATYRLTTQGGRVIDVSRTNGKGALVGDPQFEHFEDPASARIARWVYRYGSDGSPSQVDQYDERGVVVRRASLQFLPDRSLAIARFEREFGVTERERANGGGVETIFRADATSRSQIGQHRLRFDPQGRLVARIFEPVGGGAPLADARGSFGRLYRYDDRGRRVAMVSASEQGTAAEGAPGQPVAVHATWDDHDEIASVTWRDSGGHPARNQGGVAGVNIRRDAWGSMVEETFVDVRGAISISETWRYAIKRYEYDTFGRLEEATTHDAQGRPLLAHGIFRARYVRNGQGRPVEERYFDEKNLPAQSRRSGCASLRNEWDARGFPLRRRCFDTRGEPTRELTTGAHESTWVHDEAGRALDTANRAPDRSLDNGITGFARGQRTYDGSGNLIGWKAFGADGLPAAQGSSGFASQAYGYDGHGNQIRLAGFGVDGRPQLHAKEAWSRLVDEYDGRGNLTTRRWLDVEGKPTFNAVIGAAVQRFEYSANGFILSVAGFDTTDAPVLERSGCHRMAYKRDAAGRELESACFGVDDRPATLRNAGVHRIRYVRGDTDWIRRELFDADGRPAAFKGTDVSVLVREFDVQGRLTLHRSFGTTGAPTLDEEEGVHGVRMVYDAMGNCIERAVFDTDMRPMPAADDAAALRRSSFDPAGNEIETRFFGTRGEPVEASDVGWHIMRSRYDPLGRELERSFFDVDGKPMDSQEDGAHRYRSRYDNFGTQTERAYFDSADRPLLATDVGAAIERWVSNPRGDTLLHAYFGIHGEPVRGSDGVHAWVYERDGLGRLTRLSTKDIDGRLLLDRVSGVAESRRRYDSSGRLEMLDRYGADGQPVASRGDGVARWTYRYDARGNRTHEASFGADHRPVIAKGRRCSSTETAYDARNKPGRVTCSTRAARSAPPASTGSAK